MFWYDTYFSRASAAVCVYYDDSPDKARIMLLNFILAKGLQSTLRA